MILNQVFLLKDQYILTVMIVSFVLFRLSSSLLMEPLVRSCEELIERSGFYHTQKAKLEAMKLIHLMRSIGLIVSIVSVGAFF